MPEAATATLPTATSPTGPSAISSFADELAQAAKAGSSMKTEEPAKVEAAPNEPADSAQKQADIQPPKADAKAPADPKAPAEPKSTDEPDWSKAPPKWYKIYNDHKSKHEARVKELEGKIAEIQRKPVETAGDAKKVEAYEKQISEISKRAEDLEKQIAELDFSRSPKFKKQFVDRINAAYETAVNELKQLTIETEDGTRAVTEQDVATLMRLPFPEQVRKAKELLGDAAEAFLTHRNEIVRLQREGREALEQAREEAQSRRQEEEVKSREFQKQYESEFEAAKQQLVKDWPQYFDKSADNPEASAMLEKGFEYVDQVMAQADKMNPSERAAHNAVLRARAAGFLRKVVEDSQKDAKIKALEEELAKYRSGDPGNGDIGKGKVGKSDPNELNGIEAAAAKFQHIR